MPAHRGRLATARRALLATFAVAGLLPCLSSAAPAATDRPTNALLVVDGGQFASPRDLQEAVDAAGGIVRHVFWPGIAFAHVPPEAESSLLAVEGVTGLHRSHVPAQTAGARSALEESAVRAWNSTRADGRGFSGAVSTDGPFAPKRDFAAVPPAPAGPPPARFLAAGAMPYGADFYDTSEYLLGTVAVGVVYVESNGVVDPDTEAWTDSEEDTVLLEIIAGCDFWIGKTTSSLSFVYETHDSILVDYEPITRPINDEYLWAAQAMAGLGYPGADWWFSTRTYLNDLRTNYQTDWAFLTFQVDASNDPNGAFADGFGGWSYFGGPYNIIAYDDDPGALPHQLLCAHEFAHNFYALDEYLSAQVPCDARSGYLNWDNQNSNYPVGVCTDDFSCIMKTIGSTFLCRFPTKRQMGWQDGDGDAIPLVLDTNPETVLNVPGVVGVTATYSGTATVVPHPDQNPLGQGHDITLNTITSVEYRIDGGSWIAAEPADGVWDAGQETFTFTTPSLGSGTFLIEARAVNSVGNVDTTLAFDNLTLDATGVEAAGVRAFEGLSVRAVPNPFSGAMVITYTVPQPGQAADVSIFDARGTRVWGRRDTASGARREVTWNSVDEKGRGVGAGVYFVTVESGGRKETRKVVKLQ